LPAVAAPPAAVESGLAQPTGEDEILAITEAIDAAQARADLAQRMFGDASDRASDSVKYPLPLFGREEDSVLMSYLRSHTKVGERFSFHDLEAFRRMADADEGDQRVDLFVDLVSRRFGPSAPGIGDKEVAKAAFKATRDELEAECDNTFAAMKARAIEVVEAHDDWLAALNRARAAERVDELDAIVTDAVDQLAELIGTTCRNSCGVGCRRLGQAPVRCGAHRRRGLDR
jgi:hypothetical protein